MLRGYYIRPKNGGWQEITPADIDHVDATFKRESIDQKHARMAEHCEITGEFEIEVRDYKYYPSVYEVVRRAEGTTSILTTS